MCWYGRGSIDSLGLLWGGNGTELPDNMYKAGRVFEVSGNMKETPDLCKALVLYIASDIIIHIMSGRSLRVVHSPLIYFSPGVGPSGHGKISSPIYLDWTPLSHSGSVPMSTIHHSRCRIYYQDQGPSCLCRGLSDEVWWWPPAGRSAGTRLSGRGSR